MKAALVMGISGKRAGVSKMYARLWPWQINPTPGKPQFAIPGGGIDPFEEEMNRDGGADANERRGPGLFEPEDSVSEDIPNDHQRGEIPQRKKPQFWILIRIKKDGGVESG